MTREELKLKVINAEAKVERKAAILWKHRRQLDKLITTGADDYAIHSKHRDIGEAGKKLEEARATLENWKAKYAEKIKQDDYLEANAPAILVEFLDDWKRRAIDYYLRRFDSFIEFRKELRQKERDARLEALRTLPELERAREIFKDREVSDYDLANLWPRKPVESFLEQRGLEYHQIQKALGEKCDGTISRMLSFRDPAERAEWLEQFIEQERRAKLLDLIARIMKVVGRITDAGDLKIGPKGDINGIIVGTEGRAKIETIGAGGYNIQCYHFRTLIHEYKEGGKS
jgi:hypothetical protein